jgi:hypothetical protein
MNKYMAAGYPQHVAEYYALLNDAHARAFADRYGFDAVKMLQGMKIKRGQDGGAQEAGTLNMSPANPNVNPDEEIDVIDLSGIKPFRITGKSAKTFVQQWKGAPLEIGKDANGKLQIRLSRKDPDHAFWSSETRGQKDPSRTSALNALDTVLQGARQIEDIPAKHRGVNKTIRFYVPVSRGSDIVTLRIVAHEMAGQTAEIDGVELYDIIKEQPAPRTEQSAKAKGSEAGKAGVSKITIGEMLSGVKDAIDTVRFDYTRRESRNVKAYRA